MTDLPPLVHIVGVTVIGDHELRLMFEDGTVGDVAFDDSEWTRDRIMASSEANGAVRAATIAASSASRWFRSFSSAIGINLLEDDALVIG